MKAKRVKYTKDGKEQLTGLIPETWATDKLLEQYEDLYGVVEYVDLDEEY